MRASAGTRGLAAAVFVSTITAAAMASVAAAQAKPHSPLAAPTGPYAVGRTQFDWTDESRADAENPRGHREIVVWVWYPTSSRPGAEPAEWMPGKWGELFWSGFVREHAAVAASHADFAIGSVRTHAYTDAPVATSAQRFPVVMFAPGLGPTPLDYASVIEDIVSHGYVVAGVVPTYLSAATVFSDGRVVRGRDMVRGDASAPPPSVSEAFRRFEQLAATVSKDLSFALNELARLDSIGNGPLHRRLELRRVGALGHSLGGAGVAQFANDDPRVQAVVDIDGSPIWNAANGPLARPLLVLSAASTQVGYDAVLGGAKPGMQLRLAGTAHTFSSDLRLMPFASEVGDGSRGTRAPPAGMIGPASALTVTATYVEAFFDQYLRARPSPLLNGPARDFPEITFERGARNNPH